MGGGRGGKLGERSESRGEREKERKIKRAGETAR